MSKGKGPVDQTTYVRNLAGLMRKKTEYVTILIRKNLIACRLKRPPERTLGEAEAEYRGFMHEMMNPNDLIDFLSDLSRNGIHPDRCPTFLVWFASRFMKERHAFALHNINSVGHSAAALGDFGEKQHDNTGPVTTVSEFVNEEARGMER